MLEAQDVYDVLYRSMQTALRAAVRSETVDAIVAETAPVEARIAEVLRADTERVGVEAVTVRLLDVQLPSDLRKAAAGVELERRVGQVALERARGEIATLRALANAARMIEDNPRLEGLRKLQVRTPSPHRTAQSRSTSAKQACKPPRGDPHGTPCRHHPGTLKPRPPS